MFSLCYLPTAGRLTITMIKARNLKAMDITGASGGLLIDSGVFQLRIEYWDEAHKRIKCFIIVSVRTHKFPIRYIPRFWVIVQFTQFWNLRKKDCAKLLHQPLFLHILPPSSQIFYNLFKWMWAIIIQAFWRSLESFSFGHKEATQRQTRHTTPHAHTHS